MPETLEAMAIEVDQKRLAEQLLARVLSSRESIWSARMGCSTS
jgi:hypothetical protein